MKPLVLRLALVIVVVVIIGGLSLAVAFNIPPFQHSLTSGTIKTCTVIYGTAPLGFFQYCSEPLRISADWNGEWNFTATISSNSIVGNEGISLSANLRSEINQTIKEFVKPAINYGVYATNGSELWAWNPPQSTWPNMTVVSGQTFSQEAVVPTYPLHAGQSYFIKVEAVAVQFPSPDDMTLTFQFSVQ